MSAIIAHDLFAKNVYGRTFETVGGSRDEADAFLLGNQGPDPLFFAAADPRYVLYGNLGSVLHDTDATALLLSLKDALDNLAKDDRPIGRAYLLGFAGHFLLDAALHPFITQQVDALCAAGVEGLNESHASEVHAVIETELDELSLTTLRGETVANYNPAVTILKASDRVLSIVSQLYANMVAEVFDMGIPLRLFGDSVVTYRRAQKLLYSPSGIKRAALGQFERLFRSHSMMSALSHADVERTSSVFANHDHEPWTDPYTGKTHTEDYWTIFDQAVEQAVAAIDMIDADSFGTEEAEKLTGHRNFRGEPLIAVVLEVEDVPANPAPATSASESGF